MKILNKKEFNSMNWHDSVIWAMRFDDDLYFDIDYIVGTSGDKNSNKHIISPVTFVFYGVENFSININCDWVNGLEINEIEREDLGNGIYKWKINLTEGIICFQSTEYKQFSKKKPMVAKTNFLTEEERGGYNFTTTVQVFTKRMV